MTPRERVKRALTFDYPDKVPRDLWILPVALNKYGKETKATLERFPLDIETRPEYSPYFSQLKNYTKGDAYKIGSYLDTWGCIFKNVQNGVIGEVKDPVVKTLSDIDKVRPPCRLLDEVNENMERINGICRKSNKFVLGGIASTFERMQFLRGTPNLFMDIIDQPSEFFELRDIVHNYHLKLIEVWAETEVNGITLIDDWGAQNSLLISPDLWRKLFKSLYKDYCDLIHNAGKFVFMHSDGYIFDIYEDLIEIGVDAINSQLFCMDIEEIGKKFKGRITFWGEIDRQHILASPNIKDVRRAVNFVKENLYDKRGGVIAQCEFSAGSRPENVMAVFEEWEKLKKRNDDHLLRNSATGNYLYRKTKRRKRE